MIESFNYNEHTVLHYEHVPIYASSNALTGTRYFTRVWMQSGLGRYFIGEQNGKLDVEQIKALVTDQVEDAASRQYDRGASLFKSKRAALSPIRTRSGRKF